MYVCQKYSFTVTNFLELAPSFMFLGCVDNRCVAVKDISRHSSLTLPPKVDPQRHLQLPYRVHYITQQHCKPVFVQGSKRVSVTLTSYLDDLFYEC